MDGIATDDKLAGSEPLAANVLNSGGEEVAVAVQGKPLAWLHNALGWNVPENTISKRYNAAVADGRKPVIGSLFINLYRDETSLTAFQPGVSSASFQLASVSANYTPYAIYGGPVEVVQVTNPTLSVDFARSIQPQRSPLPIRRSRLRWGRGALVHVRSAL